MQAPRPSLFDLSLMQAPVPYAGPFGCGKELLPAERMQTLPLLTRTWNGPTEKKTHSRVRETLHSMVGN